MFSSVMKRTLPYLQLRKPLLSVLKLDWKRGNTKQRMRWCIIQKVKQSKEKAYYNPFF